ncbi:uncharacterized protein LOC144134429 [Amblyomma americanum]
MATEFSVQDVSSIQSDISAGGEEPGDSNKILFFVCCFILMSTLVALIFFLIGFSGDFETDSEEEAGSATKSSDGGGGGGGPAGPPPFPPPPRRSSPPSHATSESTAASATSQTTTTTPPPPLLCSVDHTATLENVYPADGLCDILIYTNVRVDKTNQVTSLNNDSYTAFITVCGGYASTSCGLSFDAPYAKKDIFQNQTTQQNLRNLPPSMKHLAILNIYGEASRLALLALTLPDVLNVLSSVRGGDRTRKLITGFGTSYYNRNDSWKGIQDAITGMLLASDTDIIVLLTAAVGVPILRDCVALPSTAWRSNNRMPPTFVS